jgi:hypothetical protein
MERSRKQAKETKMSVPNQQTSAESTQTSSNAPTHIAFQVREAKEGKGFWTRIGSAWAHKDGKGFTVQLDAVPIDGRISLRVPEEKSLR